MSHVEMYAYEIRAERLSEFLDLKDRLIEETKSLPGLLHSATFRSENQENLFIDRMSWESAEAAEAASKVFPTLPLAAQFLAMMTGPPLIGGGFRLVAGTET